MHTDAISRCSATNILLGIDTDMIYDEVSSSQKGTLSLNEKKRLMIATIGLYEQDRINFAMLERSIKKVVLLHSSHERSKQAAEQVRQMYGSDKVDMMEVDPWDYQGLLSLALKLPEDYNGFSPEYHVGLGTRVMTMALAMAALFTGYPIFMVVEDEERTIRKLQEIPHLPLNPISMQKREILEVLDKSGKRYPSITSLVKDVKAHFKEALAETRINQEIARIYRHVSKLVEWGFAEWGKDGRETWIQITSLGETVLYLKNSRRRIWSNSIRSTDSK